MKKALSYFKPTTVVATLLVVSLVSVACLIGREALRTPDDYASLGFTAVQQHNYPLALRYLTRAADSGHTQAQYRLALMYDVGDKIPENRDRAVSLMQQAADSNLPEALYALAVWQERGYPVSGDSLDYFRRAATLGHTGAMTSLVVRLEGDPVRQQYWLNQLQERIKK